MPKQAGDSAGHGPASTAAKVLLCTYTHMACARIIAVDYGTERVGLAATDPLRLFTRPVGAYSPEEAIEKLQELQEADGIERIIVGWPLTVEGEEGRATRRVKPYVDRLRKQFPEVAVCTWDERFSSARAREKLYAADAWKKAKRDRQVIDAVAAAVILEEYLEQHPGLLD